MLFDTPKVQDIRCSPNGQYFLSTHFSYDSTPHIWNRGGSPWTCWSYVGHTRLISRIVNISATKSYPKQIYVMVREWAKRAHNSQKKMAAKLALSSSFSTKFPLPPKPSLPSPFSCTYILPKRRVHHLKIHAKLGKRFLCIQMYFLEFYCVILSKLRLKDDNLRG